MNIRSTAVRLLLAVPLLAAGLAVGAPRGTLAATTCGGPLSGPETLTGTIRDSIVVPAGMFCVLDLATVRGGITIQAGGGLQATNTEIRGQSVARG